MRLSGASLRQPIPGNGFRTVASGAQKGFVEDRNNSSQRAPRDFKRQKGRLQERSQRQNPPQRRRKALQPKKKGMAL
jgi:hypothetical protein